MRRRTAAAGVLLAVLGLVGCGGEGTGRKVAPVPTPSPTPNPSASPSVSPSAQTTAAGRALEALQDSVADLGAVEVRVGTSGSAYVGRREGVADLRTGDFRASLTLAAGGRVEMIRQADLTWTRAPASYWVGLGYTAESADASRGKWVVAPSDGVKQIADAMDPGAVVRSLGDLDTSTTTSVEPVDGGPLQGNRVLTFRQSGATQRVFFTPGAHPRLLRVTSTRAGVTTTVDVTVLATPVRLRLPDADDVVQPR